MSGELIIPPGLAGLGVPAPDPWLLPGVPAAARRLARLRTSDPTFDQGCAGGLWHGQVDASVGSSTKTFDAHQAPTLAALLEALADAVEAERRGLRP